MKNCAGQTLSPSQFNDIVNQTFPEDEICENLAFFAIVPRAPIKMGITATFVALYQAYLICYTMMMMMMIIIIILSLNREFFRAKDCVRKAFRTDCPRSQSINFNERNELLFKLSQWNPFCHNHRDLGTVGQSLCYGEKDNSEKFRDINNTLIQTAKALSNLGNCTNWIFLWHHEMQNGFLQGASQNVMGLQVTSRSFKDNKESKMIC